MLRKVSFLVLYSVEISRRSQFRGPMSTGEIPFAGGTSADTGLFICIPGDSAALIADNSLSLPLLTWTWQLLEALQGEVLQLFASVQCAAQFLISDR